jgi:hypothetical protein
MPILWAIQDLAFHLVSLNLHLHDHIYYGYLLFFHLRNWLYDRFGLWIHNLDVVTMQHASFALLLAVLGGARIAASPSWKSSRWLQQIAILSGLVLPWLSYLYTSPVRGPGKTGAYVLLLAYCASLTAATSHVSGPARESLFAIAAACILYCGFAFTDWWLLWSTGALWASLLLLMAVILRHVAFAVSPHTRP